MGRELVHLHCTPVINLFKCDADPVRIDAAAHEYLLRAAETDPRHMEIYNIESVTGLQAGRTERRIYYPFFSSSPS